MATGGFTRPPGPTMEQDALLEGETPEHELQEGVEEPQPEDEILEGGEMGGEMGAAQPQGMQGQGQQPEIPESFRKLVEYASSDNIAKLLETNKLSEIGERCKREYTIDKTSRKDWLEKVEQYKRLALQKSEPKNYPFAKASNVIWPLLSMATNEFAAQAYPAIIMGRDVVKGLVIGDDDGKPVIGPDGKPVMDPSTMKPKFNPETMEKEVDASGQEIMDPESAQPQYYERPGAKRERADRIARHMSWQRLSQDENWQSDTDLLLRRLPIVGAGARKVFYDPSVKRIRTVLVAYENLVINYHARTFDSAPRVTEVFTLYPYEIDAKVRRGEFLEFNYAGFTGSEDKGDLSDVDAPQTFLEQHRRLDLDGDGYAEPYAVTVHESTGQVARITACFDMDAKSIELSEEGGTPRIVSIAKRDYYVQYSFIPNPESAVYPHGWGHYLGPINESINTSINQLFDAGHLQNAGGGFVGSQLSMHSGPLKFKVGEFKVVNTMGSNIRDAVYQMQHLGPSPVLFQMLGSLFDAGRELAGMRDITQGNMTPASTDPAALYAILEQGQKVFKDIFKRIHLALTKEFKIMFELNAKFLGEQGERYQSGDTFDTVTSRDYALAGGVEPIGDPDMITDIQKMGRAQFLLSMKDDPLLDGIEIRRRALDSVNVENIDALLQKRDGPTPMEQVQFEAMKAGVDKTRSEEIERHTAALLNMMKARQIANDIDATFWDKQIKMAQLHLEGVQNLIQATQAEARMIDLRQKARAQNAKSK